MNGITGQGVQWSIDAAAVAGVKLVKPGGISVTKVQSGDAADNFKGYIPGQFEYKDLEVTAVYTAAGLAAIQAAAGDASKTHLLTWPDGATYALATGSFISDVDPDTLEKDKEVVFKFTITQNGPGTFTPAA